MKRDCTCQRVRHQHGTKLAYNTDRCRCDECRAAIIRHQRAYRRRAAQAVWTGKVLSVPHHGTVRRLRALAAIGWTWRQVGAHMGGITSQAVSDLALNRTHHLMPHTAEAVAAVYEQLADVTPVGWVNDRMKRHAVRAGWLPPIAWDDDTIDDPDAQPMIAPPLPAVLWIEHNRMHIERVRTFDEIAVERYIAGTLKHRPQHPHTPELVEAVRRMRDTGLSSSEIGRRVGLTGDAVVKLRERRLGDAA